MSTVERERVKERAHRERPHIEKERKRERGPHREEEERGASTGKG
jgi:hypothetical protein